MRDAFAPFEGSGLAFLFPGTGTQSVGMGRDIVRCYEPARAVFDRARSVLGYDLAALCAAGPSGLLERTIHAQPAVFVLSVACLEVLRARGAEPAAVAGHSLGEWAALVAAGVLPFEVALALVRERAAAMEAIARDTGGAMVAVIGAPPGVAEEVCATIRRTGVLEVVIRNAPSQVVIAGETLLVERAEEALAAAGVNFVRLETVNAFHTPLVGPVARRLEGLLAGVSLRPPEIPFCSNFTGDFLSDPEDIRRALVEQVTGPIDWVAVCRRLIAAGYGRFIEVGPKRVLGGLLRRIDRSADCYDTTTPERLERAIAAALPQRPVTAAAPAAVQIAGG